MPFYDYSCTECGPFTEMRPMSEASIPQACPSCRTPAPRAYLRAPNTSLIGATERHAHATNEKAQYDPKRSTGHSHGPGCSCCTGSSKKAASKTANGLKRGGTRPWQISH
ncbi:MAG: FmdB family zinc ribbon protein [Alphaproteobacteria bacterium]